jgi:hypothetical protein
VISTDNQPVSVKPIPQTVGVAWFSLADNALALKVQNPGFDEC